MEWNVGGIFYRFYEVEEGSVVKEGKRDIEARWKIQDVLVVKISVGERPPELRSDGGFQERFYD